MPELPEVEISKRGLEYHIIGKNIVYTIVRNPYLRLPISSEIYNISNQLILSVQRRAKYLILELSKGWIIIHFGMSGNIKVLESEQPPSKHDHIDLVINDGKIIRYNDPRRFGMCLWSINIKNILAQLGPEPLSDEFNDDYLFRTTRRKKILIKSLLMNSNIVVGIGNIYANETLFAAKIIPTRSAMSLSKEETNILTNAIKSVLLRSIDQGGTTLRDFIHVDGNPGHFSKNLQVYGRANKPCYNCGNLIISTKHNNRTTFWCPKCQY